MSNTHSKKTIANIKRRQLALGELASVGMPSGATAIEFLENRIKQKDPTYYCPSAIASEKATHKLELHDASDKLTGKRLLLEREVVLGARKPEHKIGIYFLVRGNSVVYVGQSINILRRVEEHRRTKAFDSFAYIICDKSELNILESLYMLSFRGDKDEYCWQPPLSHRNLVSLGTEVVERY
jgi:hypothetical protein